MGRKRALGVSTPAQGGAVLKPTYGKGMGKPGKAPTKPKQPKKLPKAQK